MGSGLTIYASPWACLPRERAERRVLHGALQIGAFVCAFFGYAAIFAWTYNQAHGGSGSSSASTQNVTSSASPVLSSHPMSTNRPFDPLMIHQIVGYTTLALTIVLLFAGIARLGSEQVVLLHGLHVLLGRVAWGMGLLNMVLGAFFVYAPQITWFGAALVVLLALLASLATALVLCEAPRAAPSDSPSAPPPPPLHTSDPLRTPLVHED
jgi:hypothetical protein